MHDDLLVVGYWILLCGPAALGVWVLWREQRD
jgi:hypothetical protein